MSNFKITLTQRKHYSQYSKRIVVLVSITSVILIIIYTIIWGFRVGTVFGIFLFSCAGVTRFYYNKIYFNEPFFMIENNIIKYRIGEYGRCKSIKCRDIARMAIKDSKIEIVNINGDLTKINLGFVAEEYVRVIKMQIARLAKEMNIKLN